MDESLISQSYDYEDIEEMYRNFEAIGGRKSAVKCEDLELFEPNAYEYETIESENCKEETFFHKRNGLEKEDLNKKIEDNNDYQSYNTYDEKDQIYQNILVVNGNKANFDYRSIKDLNIEIHIDESDEEGDNYSSLANADDGNYIEESSRSETDDTNAAVKDTQISEETTCEVYFSLSEINDVDENLNDLECNSYVGEDYGKCAMRKCNGILYVPEYEQFDEVLKYYELFESYEEDGFVIDKYVLHTGQYSVSVEDSHQQGDQDIFLNGTFNVVDEHVQVEPEEYPKVEENQFEEEETEHLVGKEVDVLDKVQNLEEDNENIQVVYTSSDKISEFAAEYNNGVYEIDFQYEDIYNETINDREIPVFDDSSTNYLSSEVYYQFEDVIDQINGKSNYIPILYLPKSNKYTSLRTDIQISEENIKRINKYHYLWNENYRLYELLKKCYSNDGNYILNTDVKEAEKIEDRYVEKLNKTIKTKKRECDKRLLLNEINRALVMEYIYKCYEKELAAINKNFEEQKVRSKETLIAQLEEERQLLESERHLKISDDPSKIRLAAYYRKLQKRYSEPLTKKDEVVRISYLLDKKDIEYDLRMINESCLSEAEESMSSSEEDETDESN